MAVLPTPNLDYTDKDFDAIRRRVFQAIASVHSDWTDDQVADFGNLLIESWCFSGDITSFYQDRQAQESRFTQASLRENVVAHVKLINYRPSGRTAAQADVSFTLPAGLAGTTTLVAGSRVLTDEVTEPAAYELLTDLVLIPGQTTATATVENSSVAEVSFTSTTKPNQEVTLRETPYVDRSAQVSAANGIYTEVDNFLRSGPSDRHFVTVLDRNERARVRFGNGVNGAIPVGTGTAAYRIGGGSSGRVDAGKLRRLEGTFIDSFGNPARFTVTNEFKSRGGNDPETIGQIKQNAPAKLATNGRCVGRPDYEFAALQVPGVARALFLGQDETAFAMDNEGLLFIVPEGGGVASPGLIAACLAQYAENGPYPKEHGFQVRGFSAQYKVVNVGARVYRVPGATAVATKAAIQAALEAFFVITLPASAGPLAGTPNPKINFGFYFRNASGGPSNALAWSDLFNVVRDATQVAKVSPAGDGFTLNGFRDDLPLAAGDFPVLGTVSLLDGDTGVLL